MYWTSPKTIPPTTDDQPEEEQIVARHPEEIHRTEVGDFQLCLARPRCPGDERHCRREKQSHDFRQGGQSTKQGAGRTGLAKRNTNSLHVFTLLSSSRGVVWLLVNDKSRHTSTFASRGPRGPARWEKRAAPGPPGGQRYQGALKVSRRMLDQNHPRLDLSTSAHLIQPPGAPFDATGPSLFPSFSI